MKASICAAILLTFFGPGSLASAQGVEEGKAAFKEEDFIAAREIFLPLVDLGNADAMYFLAMMFFDGDGVPQDQAEGLRLLSLAAELGSADAQFANGYRKLENGLATPQDHQEALYWFRLAAAQGLPDAQYALGGMHAEGIGILQDFLLAHMWYNIAAANGADGASRRRRELERQMLPENIEEAQARARLCMIVLNYQDCE